MSLTGLRWLNDMPAEQLDGLDWPALTELYRIAPLGDKPPERLRTTFGNSRYTTVVCDEAGRYVGAGRVLADGADCAYVCDIVVHPAWQGRGLGAAIVQRLVDASAGHAKIILYAVPGKEPFYRRFGFRRMRTAMAIFSDPRLAAERGYLEPD